MKLSHQSYDLKFQLILMKQIPQLYYRGMSKKYDIELTVNGNIIKDTIDASTTLLDFLRSNGFVEVKKGCDKGACGAFTVLVNGTATLSCITLVIKVSKKEITTVKSLVNWYKLHPLDGELYRRKRNPKNPITCRVFNTHFQRYA